VYGVNGEGFAMTVLPVMSAGAILPVLRTRGKFHGQMAIHKSVARHHSMEMCFRLPPQTPNGVYSV
jgi:hypothetical protein